MLWCLYYSDWHGLAELCNISGEKIPNVEESSDPSNKILELWVDHNKDESTIDKLLLFLEDTDRFDVVYDIRPLIGKFQNVAAFCWDMIINLEYDVYLLLSEYYKNVSGSSIIIIPNINLMCFFNITNVHVSLVNFLQCKYLILAAKVFADIGISLKVYTKFLCFFLLI